MGKKNICNLRSFNLEFFLRWILIGGLITISASYNIEHRIISFLNAPTLNQTDNINSSYFGVSFIIRNQSNSSTALIGSPKNRQPADQPNATAPYLKPQYNEQYASGTLHSCPLSFDSPPPTCTPARPPTSTDPGRLNNRDAFGMSIGGDEHNPNVTLCTPNEAVGCDYSFFVLGSCYHSVDFGKTWSSPLPGPNISCNAGTTDLIFVLDASLTVTAPNFDLIKYWVTNVSEVFPTDSSFSIGAVVYEEVKDTAFYNPFRFVREYLIKYPVPLHPFTNQTLFQEEVKSIPYLGGDTHTAKALNFTLDQFEASPRFGDKNHRQVFILLTDGDANDAEHLESIAEKTRDLGVVPFAVGVGNNVNQAQLMISVNNKSSRIYKVDDFSGLQDIVDSLQRVLVALEGQGDDDVHNELQQAQRGFSTEQSQVHPQDVVLACLVADLRQLKHGQVRVAQYNERPTRDQKDTGSLLHLGMRFLAYIQTTNAGRKVVTAK